MDQNNPGQTHSVRGVVVAQQHVFEPRRISLQGSRCSHVVSLLICSIQPPQQELTLVWNEDTLIRSLRVVVLWAVQIRDGTRDAVWCREGVKASMDTYTWYCRIELFFMLKTVNLASLRLHEPSSWMATNSSPQLDEAYRLLRLSYPPLFCFIKASFTYCHHCFVFRRCSHCSCKIYSECVTPVTYKHLIGER